MDTAKLCPDCERVLAKCTNEDTNQVTWYCWYCDKVYEVGTDGVLKKYVDSRRRKNNS